MTEMCETCVHKKIDDGRGGHCYMFRDAPTGRCGQWASVDAEQKATQAGNLLVTFALLGTLFENCNDTYTS